MSKVELAQSLWLYTIYSKNAELIHLLESNEINPPMKSFPSFVLRKKLYQNRIGPLLLIVKMGKKRREEKSSKNYEQCFFESIKCHHNDIADYFENNFILDQIKRDSQQNDEIILKCIKYRNYLHFQNDEIIDHYYKLFELLLNKKENLMKEKMKQYPDIQTAAEKNEVEVIYSFLLQIQEISEKLFDSTKVKKITIPSSVTSTGGGIFSGCTSLTQITIPSTVTSIGKYAFYGCSSLAQITLPKYLRLKSSAKINTI